uniref:Uncharacterized protein n=1 Tax=Aegilops tauschii subsp. strangulata TaxID=200361 RepID=A0A453LFV6_AEGTS
MFMRMCVPLLMQQKRRMSLMRGRLWRGTGTRRTNTYSRPRDGRSMTRLRSGSATRSMEISVCSMMQHSLRTEVFLLWIYVATSTAIFLMRYPKIISVVVCNDFPY